MEGTYDRSKRVLRLKRIIVGVGITAIAVPVVISVILGIRVMRLKARVDELEAVIAVYEEGPEADSSVYTTETIEESSRSMAYEEEAVKEDYAENAEDTGNTGYKQIFLTFDDGPSSNTDRILDILKEYGVKATFFVVGKTDKQSVKAYQRIVSEGHTLAMHSYSHKYDEVYESRESFIEDLEKLQEYLYNITGIWPRVYRFPGGSSNTVSSVDMQELMEYLEENGITYFDWNISAGDTESGELSPETIVENCVGKIDNVNRGMILMHDASNKNTTVEALPQIISQILERGDAVIVPVTDETAPIHHIVEDVKINEE